MNCIEIKSLRKIYKKGIVGLEDLFLNVPKGSLFGFLGPNGAGKSTTINILAGIIRRDAGDISILGTTVHDEDYEYKRWIGFVLEQPTYFEKLTVKEYLEFVGSMYDLDISETKKRTDELIDFFALAEEQNEWIEKYSAGMKKKVALAAAIIHQPKLLILDEPLEGIDPVSAKQIKDMLRDMVNKGTTIFMSSHNLDTVEKLCDEVAIINKGKFVFQSKTEDIRKKMKDEASQETYQSLEEVFIDVVSQDGEEKEKKKLSWL